MAARICDSTIPPIISMRLRMASRSSSNCLLVWSVMAVFRAGYGPIVTVWLPAPREAAALQCAHERPPRPGARRARAGGGGHLGHQFRRHQGRTARAAADALRRAALRVLCASLHRVHEA